jgi:Holliday junction DNA helicase RuvA
MIGSLEGVLQDKTPTRVVINVAGVGYEVSIPFSTFYDLPDEGKVVLLRIHTHAREDTLQLFGFQSLDERTLFEELLRVSGIGPKLAMVILSGLAPETLQAVIRSEDAKALQAIPGVGKKTAQRIVLDLRDRIERLFGDRAPSSITSGQSELRASHSAAVEQVLSALENLGYPPKQAQPAVDGAVKELGEEADVEALLRYSLRSLAR